jgi:ethanolamine permease
VSITQDENSDYLAKRTYFGLYSRRHLVANSPDEEFAALAAAEEELE